MTDNLQKSFVFAINNINKEIDIDRSLRILHDLADKNNYLPAIRRLGLLYGYEYNFITQDLTKSNFYLNKASELGDTYSIHVNGRIKWNTGEFIGAIKTFENAARLNYLPSKFWLAIAYGREDLPFYNKRKSLGYLKYAAQQGHVPSIRLYITKIIEGQYGYFSLLKVPYLIFKLIFRVIKYNHYDPKDYLVR